MADPATLTAISIGTTVVGGLFGASAAKGSAKAQSQANLYQAGVADVNAKIAKQNADYQRVVGEKEAVQYGLKARQQAGQIKVAQAASGLDVNSGSNVDVQEGQAKAVRTDLDTIRANAARRAFGYETESYNQTESAKMLRRSGSNAVKAGDTAAFASILGTAGSVAAKWTQAKQYGMLGSDSGKIGYFDQGGGYQPTFR